jgi:hypothetical protein
MIKLFDCIDGKLSKNSYISSSLIDYGHFEEVTDGLGLIDLLELSFVCCGLVYLGCYCYYKAIIKAILFHFKHQDHC